MRFSWCWLVLSITLTAGKDLPGKESKVMGVPLADAPTRVAEMLRQMQQALFDRARARREEATRPVNSYDEFKAEIEKPGFLLAHWDGTRETEDKIQEETKATIRCIPWDVPTESGQCIVCGGRSERRLVFARAY